jgi:hypothetical protein
VRTVAFALAAFTATAAAAEYRGMPLEAVLGQLRDAGLPLLYSSDLVKPWMRV